MNYRSEQLELRAHGLDVMTLRCTMPDCGFVHLFGDVAPRLRDVNAVAVAHWADAHTPARPKNRRRH